jgi:hypothetical protein
MEKKSNVVSIMDESDARIDAMLDDARGVHKTVAAMESDMDALDALDESGYPSDPPGAYVEPQQPPRPVQRQQRPARVKLPVERTSVLQVVVERLRQPQLVELVENRHVVSRALVRPGDAMVTFNNVAPGSYHLRRFVLQHVAPVRVRPGRAIRVVV